MPSPSTYAPCQIGKAAIHGWRPFTPPLTGAFHPKRATKTSEGANQHTTALVHGQVALSVGWPDRFSRILRHTQHTIQTFLAPERNAASRCAAHASSGHSSTTTAVPPPQQHSPPWRGRAAPGCLKSSSRSDCHPREPISCTQHQRRLPSWPSRLTSRSLLGQSEPY